MILIWTRFYNEVGEIVKERYYKTWSSAKAQTTIALRHGTGIVNVESILVERKDV